MARRMIPLPFALRWRPAPGFMGPISRIGLISPIRLIGPMNPGAGLQRKAKGRGIIRLAILSRQPDLYSTKALVQAAVARGHDVQVMDTLLFDIRISRQKPE